MRSAIVIGGSLGGLFAANLLLRTGWDVHVYEKVAEELEGRGAGLATHPELMTALEAAGVQVDDSIGVAVQERVTLAADGSVAGRLPLPQVLTAWSRMYTVLKDALPHDRYHNGMQLAAVEQENDGVAARFDSGQAVTSQLLVAADGLRSTVRHAVYPEVKPVYAGYIAWRGIIEESLLSPRARAEAFPYFAFGLPPGEQFIAYPIAGRGDSMEPGHRRFNFVWYRPADEATTLRDMLTDSTGKVWADGIPPPLVRPEVVAEARSAARKILAPQFAEVVEKTEQLFFQPILDLESPRLAFGRIALLGDAAFVARPHCGMGVTKAAGDAMALVKALGASEDIARALKAYEKERVSFGEFIVGHARALGAYMQAQLRTEEEQAMAAKYRTVEAVMRETAIAPQVH